jgi:hypothetical protein
MPVQSIVDELELLVRSRYGLIVVDSLEDDRIEDMLRHVASRLSLHYYVWRRTKGVARGGDMGDPFASDTAEPASALSHWERASTTSRASGPGWGTQPSVGVFATSSTGSVRGAGRW